MGVVVSNPVNDSVTINGVEYVPAVRGDEEVRIVVLQRGWVVVGYYSRDGENCVIRKGSVIRNWGTSKGLPELVNGPTASTKLDKSAGDMEFHRLTEVVTFLCSRDAWEKHL